MSTYRERFDESSGDNYDRRAVDAAFREEWPTLAEVFSGIPASQGEKNGVPPATINLFWEGGRLKFCIIPTGAGRVAFGTVAGPEKGLASLEASLQAGHFEWKRRSR